MITHVLLLVTAQRVVAHLHVPQSALPSSQVQDLPPFNASRPAQAQAPFKWRHLCHHRTRPLLHLVLAILLHEGFPYQMHRRSARRGPSPSTLPPLPCLQQGCRQPKYKWLLVPARTPPRGCIPTWWSQLVARLLPLELFQRSLQLFSSQHLQLRSSSQPLVF